MQMKGATSSAYSILPGVQDTISFATRRRPRPRRSRSALHRKNAASRSSSINIVDEGGYGTAFVDLDIDTVNKVQFVANGYTTENDANDTA